MLTSEDRYRHEHIRMKKEVLGFVVQYETRVADQWLPVIRYDTRHGFAHRDILDMKGNKRKTPMFNTISQRSPHVCRLRYSVKLAHVQGSVP